MIDLRLGRYALSVCVAFAMLAGCEGTQAPISPSPARVTAQQVHMPPAYSVVFSFTGGDDGAYPFAGLLNVKGTLYGATEEGGTKNRGTVFSLSPSGAEIPHSFKRRKGKQPDANLINVEGTLYGTTLEGGANRVGTVYAITTSGKETLIHSFGASGDGQSPFAGLLNVKGTLYGTTEYGGTYGDGIVFAITPSGTETVLHSFGASGDGILPKASILNVKNTLYGTTTHGGANGEGIVFSITSTGTETVLHTFGGSGDGAYPEAGLINVNGTLYGTTSGGGAKDIGTVFAITPSGKETVLLSFAGAPGDGEAPLAGLLNVKGTLYGTTSEGGANCGESGHCGTVFSITTSGHETVLHNFGGDSDGQYPFANLINVQGTLYGTTLYGGAHCYEEGCGTVFSLSP